MAVDRLLSAPEKLTELGAEARRAVDEHFSANAMVERYETLYQQLAAKGRVR